MGNQSPFTSARWRSVKRPLARGTLTWPGVSTISRCFITPKGQYATAEPLYQRALAITEKAFGPEHPNIAKSLNNLALLCDSQSPIQKRPSPFTSGRWRFGKNGPRLEAP